MENTLVIPALIRLLDFSSIRRFKIKGEEIKFDDEIGKKALEISSSLKSKYKIDIFSKTLSTEDLSRFEHYLGNAMSNHVNKKLVPRKLNDEVSILKESKQIDSNSMQKYKVIISENLTKTVSEIKGINIDSLLNIVKKPDFITYLAGEDDLTSQFFTQSTLEINNKTYYFITTLRHSTRKDDELTISSFVALPKENYSSFDGNPTLLFLKGLDKFGIDLNVNNTLSRYYRDVNIPVDTNLENMEFLNLQNIDKTESFELSMMLKKTNQSINLKHVFAIKTKLLINDLNK